MNASKFFFQSVDVSLWSQIFQTNMTALIINNCAEVFLTLKSDNSTKNTDYFSDLEIANVRNLTLVGYDPENVSVTHGGRILPRKVTFKHIKLIKSPPSAQLPFYNGSKIESIKFINVTIENLFSILRNTNNFTELIMENITISQADFLYTIESRNDTAAITIVNSTFHKPLAQFLKGKAGKVSQTI